MAKKRRSKNSKNNWIPDFGFNKMEDETKNRIIGVLIFLFVAIHMLSLFNKAGALGGKLSAFIFLMLGYASYILPWALILLGYSLFKMELEGRWRFYLSLFLFVGGVSGLLATIKFVKPDGGALGGWLGYGLAQLVIIKIGFGQIVSGCVFFASASIGAILALPIFGIESVDDLKEKLDLGVDPKINKQKEGSMIKKIFAPKFNVEKLPEPTKINLGNNNRKAEEKSEKKQEMPLLEIRKYNAAKRKEYKLPSLDLLDEDRGGADSGDIKVNSLIIKRTLQNFGISVEVAEVNVGPSVTQYALKPAEGVNVAKIASLTNTLSTALAAHPIRIETPIPGRPLVGIEIPNKQKATVKLRNMLEDPQFQASSATPLLLALGRDVSGAPIVTDLSKMPHLLVAGSTGSGKTICLNEVILSLLYLNSPATLRLILVDPKRVEFPVYANLPHLLTPVIYDPNKTLNALKWMVEEMERRFEILASEGARDIGAYNKMMEKKEQDLMPNIVFVIDELADLMAAKGKELETGIVRLAQMARAVGIHLILATQRPSVNVITGLIKANIPCRICFRVASQIDSRTVLDMAGGEKLLGSGDMLFLSPASPKPRRLQSAFVSDKEVKRVVDYIAQAQKEADNQNDELAKSAEEMINKAASSRSQGFNGDDADDSLYGDAKKIVLETRKASTSFLQRRLRVGYARAARLIDMLEQNGVVGPGEGAKPREVLLAGGSATGGEENDETFTNSDDTTDIL